MNVILFVIYGSNAYICDKFLPKKLTLIYIHHCVPKYVVSYSDFTVAQCTKVQT